jgi:RNA-directed DNA polymerase
LLADLGLEPKEAKTRTVHLGVEGEGFTFLGFHHQMVRSPARWQSPETVETSVGVIL